MKYPYYLREIKGKQNQNLSKLVLNKIPDLKKKSLLSDFVTNSTLLGKKMIMLVHVPSSQNRRGKKSKSCTPLFSR